MKGARRVVSEIMERAGVGLNGDRPWDIRVKDDRLFPEILAGKNLGLGEGYMKGWWECERVDEFIFRMVRSGAEHAVRGGLRFAAAVLPALVRNLQTVSRSRSAVEHHYDLDNDLFGAFLDPYRQYSCAYFKDTDELDAAQRAKMHLICGKLGLGPGMRLLDIGCGWGGLARFAAEEYGCWVTGINISRRQIAFAREFCAGSDVEILECDYRQMNETFDRIVSVGMFEHVGRRNDRRFMETVARCLEPDGVFLLHTIGANESRPWCDPWINRYIFPNGCIPGPDRIARAAEGLFVMEDWHNFGPYYDTTLMCWLANFRRAWPELSRRYDDTFRRMWEYYLQCSAGAFRARDIQLWQVVFTPAGREQPECRI